MKKIVGILAVAAMATSLFAVDVSARLVEKGSLAGGVQDGDTYLFGMGKTHQKDNDLLEFQVASDKSGAFFRLWCDMGDADDKNPIRLRHANFWFKPVDMLKITIGRSAPGLYTERIDWWKVGTAEKISNVNGWGGVGRYSSSLDGYGVMFELTPVDGLYIAAQVCPGVGEAFVTKPNEGDATYKSYAILAKYQIADAISAGAQFRDNGKDSWKLIRAGIEFGNWGTTYYGFLQPVFLLNGLAKDSGLDGICFDNYFSYNFGFMNLQARIPVTIRLSGNDDDPSYLIYNIKASFPQSGWTPYVQISSIDLDEDGTYTKCGAEHIQAIAFDNFKFNTSLKIGASLNVGAVGLDIAAAVNIDTADNGVFGWYVPFVASIGF
jgi:hypothetical protein